MNARDNVQGGRLTVAAVAGFLENFAPSSLAADWDNVGLLVGNARRSAERIMTCLTISGATAAEAIKEGANLIVAHHPLPFRPLRRLTAESHEGALLLELAAARIAVYSPHTGFDSAPRGVNQQLAEALGLNDIRPLEPSAADPTIGVGRVGVLPGGSTLGSLAQTAANWLKLPGVQIVGDASRSIRRVAVGCGSAGDLIPLAEEQGRDAFVTGEARFHACLEAESANLGLVLLGHYASERFAVEQLAVELAAAFPTATVWPSRDERDPLHWFAAIGLAPNANPGNF